MCISPQSVLSIFCDEVAQLKFSLACRPGVLEIVKQPKDRQIHNEGSVERKMQWKQLSLSDIRQVNGL